MGEPHVASYVAFFFIHIFLLGGHLVPLDCTTFFLLIVIFCLLLLLKKRKLHESEDLQKLGVWIINLVLACIDH